MSWKLGKVDTPVCHVVPELWRGMGRLVGTCHEAASLFLVAASGVTIFLRNVAASGDFSTEGAPAVGNR